MRLSDETFQFLLSRVEKPTRYTGHEYNAIVKNPGQAALLWALAFPDVYEIGMDNLAIQILYHILNGQPDIACERVFAPWTDLEALLRQVSLPLFTLENRIPLSEVDILGFTLPYEIVATNVLAMLSLGAIPLESRDRRPNHPLVIGGGALAFNPEPMADFFDAFVLGDGEEVVLEISEVVTTWKRRGKPDRQTVLEALAAVPGVYVPSFYEPVYDASGRLIETRALDPSLDRPRRRVVADLDAAPYPVRPVIPNFGTVHDRLVFEMARGCTAGCRFCQAGAITRPVRERQPETLLHHIDQAIEATGYDAISLNSLSPGDYSCINTLLKTINARYAANMIATSVSSLQVKTLTPELTRQVVAVKRSNFTMAPEAGTQRLRDAINKNVTDEDVLETTRVVFENGGQGLKLYFMIGLPGETDEDILGIVDLTQRVMATARRYHRRPKVTASVSTFVPKPFTPYQWAAQISPEETRRRQDLLRKAFSSHRRIGLRLHHGFATLLEGVFSRGDRRLARVLLEAHRLGCRFDGWKEHLAPEHWHTAFQQAGLSPAWYLRERVTSEALPWDHLHAGISRKFLLREWQRHAQASTTPDCRWGECGACGACDRTVKVTTFDGQDPAGTRAQAPGEGRNYRHPPVRLPLEDHRSTGPRVTRNTQPPRKRLRFRYTKTGMARFIGHLELVRVFVLALKRVGVQLRYSQGYHPAPRIVFSNPLPVGVESLVEFVDMEVLLHGITDPADIQRRLNEGQLPPGIRLIQPEPLDFSINSMVSVTYEIRLPPSVPISAIEAAVVRFQSTGPWTFVRKKRTINMHTLVLELGVLDGALHLELATPQSGTMKPSELLARLFPDVDLASVRILKRSCKFAT